MPLTCAELLETGVRQGEWSGQGQPAQLLLARHGWRLEG